MSTLALTPPPAAISSRPASRVAWLGFLVVLTAAVMDLLDSTITQTAAPAIRRELGGSYADLEWISAAYTLAMSVGIAAVGTVFFDQVGSGHGPIAFMGAADHALLVTVAFLLAAGLAVFWLPKHARESQQGAEALTLT